MAAQDYLLGRLAESPDIGNIFSGSAQTGLGLGSAFQAQQQQLLAVAAENRAANQATFEASVRAGAALGEGLERGRQSRLKEQELRVAEENARLRRAEFLARRGDAYFDQATQYRQQSAQNQLLPGVFSDPVRPVDPRTYDPTFDGGSYAPTPGTGQFEPSGFYGEQAGLPMGAGGQDSTLFDGSANPSRVAASPEQGTLPPAVTSDQIQGGIKTTWFNSQETPPTHDPYTPKGLGAWGDNKRTPNAIALSGDMAQALGAQRGALLAYETASGEVGYGTYEDIAGASLGLTGIIDLDTTHKSRVGTDQPVARAWVVSQGDDRLSGDQLSAFALDNYNRYTQTPQQEAAGQTTPAREQAQQYQRPSTDPVTNETVQANQGPVESERQTGQKPTDEYFDGEYIKRLPPTQRAPFFKEAKKEQRALVGMIRKAETDVRMKGAQIANIDAQIELTERQITRAEREAEARAEVGGLSGAGPLLEQSNEARGQLEQRLQAKSQLIAEQSRAEQQVIGLKQDQERVAENLKTAQPEFKTLDQSSREKITSILNVSGSIDQIEETFFSIADNGDWSRVKGAINEWVSTAKPIEDPNKTKLGALVNSIIPDFARGLMGETGVLTDADRKAYAELLPTLRNSRAEATALISVLRSAVQRNAEGSLTNARLADADAAQLRAFYDEAGIKYNPNKVMRGALDPNNPRPETNPSGELKQTQPTPQPKKLDSSKYKDGQIYFIPYRGKKIRARYNGGTNKFEPIK